MDTDSRIRPTDEQIRAAHSNHPITVVDAVAGSGKTETVSLRVNWLKEQFPGEPIICLTYTNAAASQINSRIEGDIEYIGTLHSYCFKLVSEAFPDYCIVTDSQSAELFLDTMIRYSEKDLSGLKKRKADGELNIKDTEQLKVFDDLCHSKRISNYEQIVRVASRFAENKGMHLLVDEYQDSSNDDWKFYESLEAKTRFFVGDINQNIYSFRGAKGIEFPEDTKRLSLVRNFRVPAPIAMLTERATGKYCGSVMTPVGWSIGSREISQLSDFPEVFTNSMHRGTKAVICRKNYDCEKVYEMLKDEHNCELVGSNKCTKEQEEAVSTIANGVFTNNNIATIFFKRLTGYTLNSVPEEQKNEVFLESLNKCDEIDVKIYGAVKEAMEETGRWTDWNRMGAYSWEPQEGVVSILTTHKAKGHEFDNVFIYNLAKGQFPSSKEDEEDDRIMYVALTRSRKTVNGIYCRNVPVRWKRRPDSVKEGKYWNEFKKIDQYAKNTGEGRFWRNDSSE